MLFPIKPKDFHRIRFTSKYGYRTHPVTGARGSFHRGIDISSMGREGVIPLLASDDGVIQRNRPNPSGYGNYVIIRHKNNIYTLYGHLYALSKYKEGQRVTKGTTIALIGNTGASTGAHVHYEIHDGGHTFPSQTTVGSSKDTTVNPEDYFPSLSGFYLKRNLAGFESVSHQLTKVLWVGRLLSQVRNVRDKPSMDSRVIGQINQGDYVTVYQEREDWIQVGEGAYVSNVNRRYIVPVSDKLYDARVSTGSLNVRSIPSTDHDVLSSLTEGSVVPVYGEFCKWLYIGKGEFVHGSYTLPVKDIKEDDGVDKAILVYSMDDMPTAKRLADRLKCAITFDAGYVKAKELYVVGGQPPSNYDGKLIPLGGTTYFKTVANVNKYLDKR